jgi:hypothetical protein
MSSGAVVWGCVMGGVRGRFHRKEPYPRACLGACSFGFGLWKPGRKTEG